MAENPANDPDGRYCAKNQNDPNVWFVAGAFGGKADRNCSIPSGKAVLILIVGAECSYAEDSSLKNEQDLRDCAISSNKMIAPFATIDGFTIKDWGKYRVTSPLYSMLLPDKNVWNVKGPQETQSIADGWYLFLKPLPSGSHKIAFGGQKTDITATSGPSYAFEVTYDLTIK